MTNPEAAYDAIARLRRFGEPTATKDIDQELNEACKLTGEPRIDARGSLEVLRSRGQAEEVDGEWRLRVVEKAKVDPQGSLF